jgi:hypothetical protein
MHHASSIKHGIKHDTSPLRHSSSTSASHPRSRADRLKFNADGNHVHFNSNLRYVSAVHGEASIFTTETCYVDETQL